MIYLTVIRCNFQIRNTRVEIRCKNSLTNVKNARPSLAIKAVENYTKKGIDELIKIFAVNGAKKICNFHGKLETIEGSALTLTNNEIKDIDP